VSLDSFKIKTSKNIHWQLMAGKGISQKGPDKYKRKLKGFEQGSPLQRPQGVIVIGEHNSLNRKHTGGEV
jgi:hypothetical protein